MDCELKIIIGKRILLYSNNITMENIETDIYINIEDTHILRERVTAGLVILVEIFFSDSRNKTYSRSLIFPIDTPDFDFQVPKVLKSNQHETVTVKIKNPFKQTLQRPKIQIEGYCLEGTRSVTLR